MKGLEALTQLEATVEAGAYDGLLGFSQGAVLITLLTARRLSCSTPPGGGDVAAPPSWRFNVLVAGMPVRDDRYAPLFASPLSWPCVIAQGRTDPFYEWRQRGWQKRPRMQHGEASGSST